MEELGQQLHDRATRGETLSPQEQKQLDAWYAAMDRAEIADLGLGEETGDEPLVARIDATLAEIAKVTQRIRDLDTQTRTLRRENAALRLRLTRQASTQRA